MPEKLTEQQKRAIKSNLARLDYAKGNGLLKVNKKKLLSNEAYLFISAGGTGHKALAEIKQQIERTIDPNYVDRIGYLVVDCAHNELDLLVEKGTFDQTEVVKLPFEKAWEDINPDTMQEDKKLWADPRLYDQVNGGITTTTTHPGFENNGAGAWRQPGRVRLTTVNGFNLVKQRVNAAVNELMSGQGQLGAVKSLKVFFLCSVAGGTGSGTIIDLAYITRHVLMDSTFNAINTKKLIGYIFGPDTCEGRIDEKHNPHANHIAAMKEIDYLMRAAKCGPKEGRSFKYGNEIVKTEASVFDTCVLVDGRTALTGFGDEAPDAARKVVARTILNSMTSGNITGGVRSENLVDSVFSNSANDINASLKTMRPTDYPRYKGYHFNASGFASLVIPTELLTAVLAQNVLNMLWDRWSQRSDDDAAKRFLEKCGIRPKKNISIDKKTLRANIEREAKWVIKNKNKGLIYMMDLAKNANTLLRSNDYIGHAQNHSSDWIGGKGWEDAADKIRAAEKKIKELNNGCWEVTRVIYETLKDLLEKEAGILTDVGVYERTFNKTLYFCPIDLTGQQRNLAKGNALLDYLFKLYPEEQRKRMADEFGDALFTQFNSAQLTGINWDNNAGAQAQFDPATVIQNLIQTQFAKLINDNVENFIVKFYSEDPNATPTVPDPDDPARQIASPAMKSAARTIYNILTTKGCAMAVIMDTDIKNYVPANRYITVPSRCENLLNEIKLCVVADTTTMGRHTHVYTSEATDELTMVEMYQGLPAYEFASIVDHEREYEAQCDNPAGIHIVEADDFAHNWANLANPCKGANETQREAMLRKQARDDYDKANELGMVRPDTRTRGWFEICRIRSVRDQGSVVDRSKTKEFEAFIESLKDKPLDELTRDTCVAELVAADIVEYRPLSHELDANTYNSNPLTNDQYYEFAWNTLRQKFHLWNDVKASIEYFEKLRDAIASERKVKEEEQRRDELFVTFTRVLRAADKDEDENTPAFLRFDDGDEAWYIKPETDEVLLADVSFDKFETSLHRECKEYFAFDAFAKLSDEDFIKPLKDKVKERNENRVVRAADRDHGAEMAKQLAAVRNLTKPKYLEYDFPMASSSFVAEANKYGDELADRIRKFYDRLIHDLPR